MSVGLDFNDLDNDHGAEAVRAALDSARFAAPDFPPVGEPDADRRSFTALPFTWRDPATIPRRKFLYGFELRRKQISATIAPGAGGKTTFKVGRAICLAANVERFGHRVWDGPHRVWLWNLEDEAEEVEKIVHAFLKLWGMSEMDLGGRLFINGADSLGSNGLKLAVEDNMGKGFRIQRPVSEALIEELKRLEIDYLDVDPFVSCHAVDENSNQAIDAVSKEWLRVAHEANCAIGLAHHLRKATGAEFTANDARGAGAMINAARSALVLQRMSKEQAQELRIEECDRKRYISVYDDKNNKAPPAFAAEWYEFHGIGLGNGDDTGPEDNVGALQRWMPPDAFGGVSSRQLAHIQRMIADQPDKARKHPKSRHWVGKLVAHVLGSSLDEIGEARRIEKMVAVWCANGALKTVERANEKREIVEYVEVGKCVVLD